MLPLHYQSSSHTLLSPCDGPPLIFATTGDELPVQVGDVESLGHGHPVIPAKVADLTLHAPLLVAFAWRAELTLESPMGTEGDEPRRLFPPLPAQNLLYRGTAVVVTKPAKHAREIGERPLVALQKRLLRRMEKGTVERGAAGHAAHGKALQLGPLSRQVGVGIVPVHLRLHTPVVTLGNERLLNRQAQSDLALMDITANRPFAELNLRHLMLDPLPDPMGCVSLLPRRLLIRLQNLIYVRDCRRQFPARPLHLLPRYGQGAANRLPHHTPMDVQLLGDSGNRPDAKFVLSADLLEKLHLCSPLQRVPPLRAIARLKGTRSSGGWAKLNCRSGPIQNTEINPAPAPQHGGDKRPAVLSLQDQHKEARDQLSLVLSFFSRVDAKASALLAIDTGMLALLTSIA